MENVADISEPQVSYLERKDPYIKFLVCLFRFQW